MCPCSTTGTLEPWMAPSSPAHRPPKPIPTPASASVLSPAERAGPAAENQPQGTPWPSPGWAGGCEAAPVLTSTRSGAKGTRRACAHLSSVEQPTHPCSRCVFELGWFSSFYQEKDVRLQIRLLILTTYFVPFPPCVSPLSSLPPPRPRALKLSFWLLIRPTSPLS